jgi:hypothetical protein
MLERLLEDVRAGESRALVLRGEPGIGKTALLEHAVESAPEFRLARAAGVEAERELAFAALQQLCAPMLDRLDLLPAPQREALGVAFGVHGGDPPDRFLVGLAALSLVSEIAGDQPLLCVIDDSHWLDRASAQALAFVARRLLAESIAVVFATREQQPEFQRLPELVVEGLRADEAGALLDSVVTGPLDERVRDRIVDETGREPAGAARAAARVRAGGPGRWLRPAGCAAVVRPDRGELSAAARRPPAPDPTHATRRRRRADRRTRAVVVRGRPARHRGRRRGRREI